MNTYVCINGDFDLGFTSTGTFEDAFERLKEWSGYDAPDLRYMSPILPDENPITIYLKGKPRYYIYQLVII